MNNLDWLSDALGDFEDDYVRRPPPVDQRSSLTPLLGIAHHRLPRSNRS